MNARGMSEDVAINSEHQPPGVSVALYGFGGAAVVLSILFLGGAFYVTNELGRAFCLGAFFSGLLGSILLFGFAKVIELLDEIRAQTQRGVRPRSSARQGHDSGNNAEG